MFIEMGIVNLLMFSLPVSLGRDVLQKDISKPLDKELAGYETTLCR